MVTPVSGQVNAAKTHCYRGHPLSGDNLKLIYRKDGRFRKRFCIACSREYQHNYYLQPHVKVQRAKRRPGLEKNRAWRHWQKILDAYGDFCACCGEREIEFLTLDHIKGGGYAHRRLRNSMAGIYLDVIREGFPKDKYRILCMQCNWATRRGGICPHQRRLSVATVS